MNDDLLTVTATPCGTSSHARDEVAYTAELRQVRRNWLDRLWNRFVGFLFGTPRDEGPLIVGGSPAAITEAPFMAFVSSSFPKQGLSSKKTAVGCSAAIISEQWILTAAQCLYDGRGFVANLKFQLENEMHQTCNTSSLQSTGTYSLLSIPSQAWMFFSM